MQLLAILGARSQKGYRPLQAGERWGCIPTRSLREAPPLAGPRAVASPASLWMDPAQWTGVHIPLQALELRFAVDYKIGCFHERKQHSWLLHYSLRRPHLQWPGLGKGTVGAALPSWGGVMTREALCLPTFPHLLPGLSRLKWWLFLFHVGAFSDSTCLGAILGFLS